MLGADTRSTSGTTVADKNCAKIHYVSPNLYACGAGTAADLEHVSGACLGPSRWPGPAVLCAAGAGLCRPPAVTRMHARRRRCCAHT